MGDRAWVQGIVPAPRTTEGDGFEVRRAFPNNALAMIDPFLLLDHMGPSDYGPGEAKGAPDHPHRGFETVTYMLEGAFEHRDSQGNRGRLGPGDVQWMTAGAGIVHSEMPPADIRANGGRVHGLQLWVNLPAEQKMTRPRYQDVRAEAIPELRFDGGVVRVIAGELAGNVAVVETSIPIQYLHVQLDGDGSFDVPVPAGHQGFAYVVEGSVAFEDGRVAAEADCVVLSGGSGDLSMRSRDPVSCIVATGRPIGEPVARWGPFVMNTEQEIKQAFADFQAGRFGTIEPIGLDTLH